MVFYLVSWLLEYPSAQLGQQAAYILFRVKVRLFLFLTLANTYTNVTG